MANQQLKKAIIDCDVGVDDALALILAFHSPELEVKAVTGVNGNVPLDFVFSNIQKVLSLIQPSTKPVIAKGATQPLRGKSIYAHSVHGEGGLGNAVLEPSGKEAWWQADSRPADELMIELARRHPGEITLVALGPLTNLALAFQKDPRGMRNFKDLVIMGGAVREKGNITPHAEFNFFTDPLAAKIVMESAMPMTLVPLDATHRVSLTPRIMEEKIRPLGNRFSRFVMEACQYDSARRQFREGAQAVFLHDPLAVGVAIDPSLAGKERIPLRVQADEGDFFGKVIEGMPADPPVDVCFEVQSEGFLDLFVSRLKE